MRYRKDHTEKVKKKLLAEAGAALWRRGPPSVPIMALMERIGRTHGGFYLYFGSKDELVADSIVDMFDRSCAYLNSISCDQEPATALAAYINSYLSERQSEFRREGCAIPALATDVSRMGSKERALFAEGTRRLCAELTKLISALGFDDEESPSLALSLLSELSGAILIARAFGRSERSASILERV